MGPSLKRHCGGGGGSTTSLTYNNDYKGSTHSTAWHHLSYAILAARFRKELWPTTPFLYSWQLLVKEESHPGSHDKGSFNLLQRWWETRNGGAICYFQHADQVFEFGLQIKFALGSHHLPGIQTLFFYD